MALHNGQCGRSHDSSSSSSRVRTIAVLGLALLQLTTTPCAGRTSLRGSTMTPQTAVTRRVQYGGGGEIARNRRTKRRLQTAAGGAAGGGSATTTEHTEPICTSLFVPRIAGLFTGTYTHSGHFNDHRPVFSNPITGCNIFASRPANTDTNSTGTVGSGEEASEEASGNYSWFMTNPSAKYFLSLESSVYEPAELPGLESWVRHNDPDPTCAHAECFASMLLNCTVYTADLFSSADPTSPPTASSSSGGGNGTSPSPGNETAPTTAAPTTNPPSAIPTPSPAAVIVVANPTSTPTIAADPTSIPTTAANDLGHADAAPTPTPAIPTTPAPSAATASGASDKTGEGGGDGEDDDDSTGAEGGGDGEEDDDSTGAGGSGDGGEDDDSTGAGGGSGDGEDDEADTTAEDTSSLSGCVNLQIRNGGTRAGVYLLNTTSSINDRPTYAVAPATTDIAVASAAGLRTGQVFSQKISVCASGWGVVNSTYAENVGPLPITATPRAVFLMYVAENLEIASDSECAVDVWFIVDGGVASLGDAGVDTFISVSSVEDPSDASVWAKYTPATATEGAKLVDNSWIDVGCADAAAVEDAGEDAEAMVVPTPPSPVGEEPNGR